ncbi:MAG: hypothetical protein Q7S10_02485, partial [bacterium]|nr:hypothetical protein [bacterium]
VDRICQYFKASFLPFGGMQVVLSGDFFQLPPIEKYGEEVEFITESSAWKNMDMKICYLQGQFRHKDKKLAELLEYIRDNDVNASRRILALHKSLPAGEFATKLYTHNVDVDGINNVELGKINGKEFTYKMSSTGKGEIVEVLKRSCLSPETLVLKKGARVMFIKNNFDQGYVNGTQGTVVDFDIMGMPVVETLDGQKIAAMKASWKIEDEESRVVAEIMQLPLRLAWAITVHKSQGMNLDAAQIDLSRCFVKGMGYVAISRLKTLAGLHLVGANDMAFCVNEKAIEMDAQFKVDSEDALEILSA